MSATNTQISETSTRHRIAAMTASVLLAAAGSASIMALPGCNTTKGMGEDIEAVGDSISDEADDAKN